jgi:hypothetical protein
MRAIGIADAARRRDVQNNMKRSGILGLALVLLVLGARALAQAPVGERPACREEREILERLEGEVARLSVRHDAIAALSKGTLASDVSLDDLFEPAPLADGADAAAAQPDRAGGLPDTLVCAELQDRYEQARSDLLWLRESIDRQQRTLWAQLPEQFREELGRLWTSRQQLVRQFEKLDPALAAIDSDAARSTRASIEKVHEEIRSLRLGLLRVMPELGSGLSAARVAAFMKLWREGFEAEPLEHAPRPEELAELPPQVQVMARDYLALARLDVLEIREVLNRVRIWMRLHADQTIRLAALEEAGGKLRVAILEFHAIRNSLARLASQFTIGYRERYASESSRVWMLVSGFQYAAGLAAFPLLLVFARRLAGPAAALHGRIAQSARRNRVAAHVSRATAGLPPLLPWIVGWFGLDVLGVLFAHYRLAPLVALVPFARLYIVYGLFCLFGEWLLLRIAQQAGVYLTPEQAREIVPFVKRSAAAVTLPWLMQDMVSTAIGPSTLREFCVWLGVIVLVIVLGLLLRRRRHDLVLALQSFLPQKADPWVEKWFGGPLFLLLAPLSVPPLLIGFGLLFVHKTMVGFDWYRKLAARGFKLRAYATEATDEEAAAGAAVADEYGRWFGEEGGDFRPPFIDTGLAAAIRDRIDPWLADKTEENTLLITGERGIGKSMAVDRVQQSIAADYAEVALKYVDVPAKTASAEAVKALVGKLLETDLGEGPAALVKTDSARTPTLIILDNAQNFFLRRVGGLEGWRALLALTNARVSNVFWMIVINNQSWAYLDNVFGGDYQFRNRLRCKPWSQNDIRSLILSRNQLSGFRIRYDDILLAARGPDAGNIRNAEQRYFGLLWDACRGNPMLALRLWMTSVRTEGRNVTVGLPAEPSSAALERLGSEYHFVYAAIVIHENITGDELFEVTALPDSVLRSALKTAFDAGFVERTSKRRYRVVPFWYFSITNLLARKNLLHE